MGIFTIKGRADVVQLDDEGQGKTIRVSEDGKKLFVDIVSYDQSNEPRHGDLDFLLGKHVKITIGVSDE